MAEEVVTDSNVYADPIVREMHRILDRTTVTIVPLASSAPTNGLHALEPGGAGSGTCIRIGGRFFIATAGHVIKDRDPVRHFVCTPRFSNESLELLGGGVRGGGPHDELDLGWLELAPRGAADADRHFLDVNRIRTHCTGVGERLVFVGSPIAYQEHSAKSDAPPEFTAYAAWAPVRALHDRQDLRADPDLSRHLYLEWPELARTASGEWYRNPYPLGMSGGGVWAPNIRDPEKWSPDHIQLVGVEYALRATGVPERYLVASQMQLWLEMVADDVPALRPFIDPVVAAGRYLLG